MISTEAFQEALDYITTHPERWFQGGWAYVDGGSLLKPGHCRVAVDCGSTACLAGEVVIQHGYKLIGEPDVRSQMVTLCAKPEDLDPILQGHAPASTISQTAMAVLGIDDRQADALFWGGHSLVGLWALAFEFTQGAIQLPAYIPGAFKLDEDDFKQPTEPVHNVPAAVLEWWGARPRTADSPNHSIVYGPSQELNLALGLLIADRWTLSHPLQVRLEAMVSQLALTPP